METRPLRLGLIQCYCNIVFLWRVTLSLASLEQMKYNSSDWTVNSCHQTVLWKKIKILWSYKNVFFVLWNKQWDLKKCFPLTDCQEIYKREKKFNLLKRQTEKKDRFSWILVYSVLNRHKVSHNTVYSMLMMVQHTGLNHIFLRYMLWQNPGRPD